MMGFAFGGLAVISVPARLGVWSSLHRFLLSVEIRSLCLALLALFVLIVLAYLTNPSETSFRAFLTEQSFRHHLSRLDDAQDDHHPIDQTSLLFSDGSKSQHDSLDSSPLQFADRASVSLRTPKHSFRSFGVLTVAAVIPTGGGGTSRRLDGCNPSVINDSWFIGAFGMWWWVAHLDNFWRELGVVGAKEDGSAVSGILEMTTLDRAHDRSTVPPTNAQLHTRPNSKQQRASRERFAQHTSSGSNSIASRRSSTPPPLPKSASLPLHAKRPVVPSTTNQSPSSFEHHNKPIGSHNSANQGQAQHSSHSQTFTPMATAAVTPPDQVNGSAHSNCTLLSSSIPCVSKIGSGAVPHHVAQSPQVTDVLRQVNAVQASVVDLQQQLSSATSQSNTNTVSKHLQSELEQHRARKQVDDATRTEIRTRTRALEDSKRHAESSKREIDKKVKTAQNAAATSERRTTTFVSKTNALRDALKAHSERAEKSQVDSVELCTTLKEEVEIKKGEAKEVEEVLSALLKRVKELEAKVAAEEERLRRAREVETERREAAESHYVAEGNADPVGTLAGTWLSPASHAEPRKSRSSSISSSVAQLQFLPDGFSMMANPDSTPSKAFISRHPSLGNNNNRSKDFSAHSTFAPFSPIADPEDQPISPLSSSFIPSSLIESLGIESPLSTTSSGPASSYISSSPSRMDQADDSTLSRSFQSEDDVILERRNNAAAGVYGLAPGSSASSTTYTPASLSPALPLVSLANERIVGFGGSRSDGILNSAVGANGIQGLMETSAADVNRPVSALSLGGRRWFGKDRKGHSASVGGGLNPDAKEFSLPKDRARTLSNLVSKPRAATVTAGSVDGLSNGHATFLGGEKLQSSEFGMLPSYESTTTPPSNFSSPAAANALPALSATPSSTSSPNNSKFFGFGGGLGLGSSPWFNGPQQSAFAPTPLEREALTRALAGGSSGKNASTERLFQTSAVGLGSVNNAALTSNHHQQQLQQSMSTPPPPGLISRPSWLHSLRKNGKAPTSTSTTTTTFSPFDDGAMEKVLHVAASSASSSDTLVEDDSSKANQGILF